MDSLKTTTGRCREACVARVHELRAAFDEHGRAQRPRMTYQQIAQELGLSVGTVYNICTGRTHRDDVPLGHPKYKGLLPAGVYDHG